MKIVYVVHEFPPDYIGGTGATCFQVAKGMLARGHKVWVLTYQPWMRDDFPSLGFFDEKVDGLSVRRLIFNSSLSPNPILYEYYNPILSIYAKDFLRAVSPDIIHIYHLLNLSSSIIDSAKELEIPTILTLTDFWFICPKCSLLKPDGEICDGNPFWEDCIYCLKEPNNLYEKIANAFDERIMRIYDQEIISKNKFPLILVNDNKKTSLLYAAINRLPFLISRLKEVDHVVCHSLSQSKIFVKRGCLTNGFTLCSPGVNSPQKGNYKKEEGPNITFGYFGGGEKNKGPHILLEAFREITSQKARLKLYGIFPSTEYVRTLRKIAKGDERICFMGEFQHKEVEKILVGIDVLVLPAICYHGFSMSILEAFANKVPVIATDIGGISEIVNNEHNGLLFRRGDVLELKEKMERIINEPELLRKFQENMPRVKSVSEECDELSCIYERLVIKK